MNVELWADRFVLEPVAADRRVRRDVNGSRTGRIGSADQPVIEPRIARDLSTGATVTIIESTVGGVTEQLQWSLRCGRFAAWHQPQLARLVDYGLIGIGRRFEAWRAAPPRLTADAGLRASASAFLEANDLRPCSGRASVLTWAGQPVVVPDPDAGHEMSVADGCRIHTPQLAACALESIGRPAVAAVAEVLADPERREPTALALWGEPGAGRNTAVRTLARLARLQGYVPVDAAAEPRWWDLVGDRTVLLIDRGRGRWGWRRLLEATARRGRPHVLLVLAEMPVPGVHNLQLAPIAAASLVDAVRPYAWAAASRAALVRAAEKAAGNPWRFAASFRSGPGGAGRRPALAAERRPRYRVAPSANTAAESRLTAVNGATSRCSPLADVARLRQRLHAALRKLVRKPGAAALRETRILIHALARRQDWGTATEGALALVGALIRRGHAAEAGRVIHDAGAWVAAGRDERAHGELALATAALHLAQGMIADAEVNARAALAAAVARGDAQQHVRATAVLAEALFWLGRHEEAREIVAAVDHGVTDDRLLVPIAIAAACAAVGSRSASAAPSAVARAVAASERLGDAAWRARALAAAAFVQLALDDRGAAGAAAARALAAAHAAGDPLLALEARLIAVEVERREGRLAPAARLLRRMKQWPASRQPATIAARVALLREAITGHPAHIAAERAAARTGLRALALFVPQPDSATAAALLTDDVLELISEMHDAGDDRSALTRICSRVRMRLRAAGVAFLVAEPAASTRVLAGDGARLDPGLGARVLAADCPIHDAPPAGGHESGVPVRYGGRTLGVLIARWRAGVAPAHHRASAVLSIAAIVSAPAMAAVLREPELPPVPDAMVGISDSIAAVRQAIERAANAPYPVLIEGESGSGKELVARALHRRSRRRDRPFVAINCAALPDDLLEAELFGHAKGAFTGAMIERAGVFEEAHGGTLFLDEVGELSPRAQAKLLRTLQDGEVRRVGENQARRVDVRVVAATNRQLRQEVASGAFRLDLLYRLDVVRIAVPPLRERLVDLPLLIERYWREATDRVHSRAVLSAATVAALSRHQWPGNVRELQNVLASLAVRAPRRGVVPPTALPWTAKVDSQQQRLDVARRAFEAEFIQSALVRAGGHRGRAASELGVSRQGLTKLMTRLAIAGVISEPASDAGPGTVRESAPGRESAPDCEPARDGETRAGGEPALQSGTI